MALADYMAAYDKAKEAGRLARAQGEALAANPHKAKPGRGQPADPRAVGLAQAWASGWQQAAQR